MRALPIATVMALPCALSFSRLSVTASSRRKPFLRLADTCTEFFRTNVNCRNERKNETLCYMVFDIVCFKFLSPPGGSLFYIRPILVRNLRNKCKSRNERENKNKKRRGRGQEESHRDIFSFLRFHVTFFVPIYCLFSGTYRRDIRSSTDLPYCDRRHSAYRTGVLRGFLLSHRQEPAFSPHFSRQDE